MYDQETKTETPVVVSVEDALTLRQAREALRRIEKAAVTEGVRGQKGLVERTQGYLHTPDPTDFGRLAEAAEVAEGAIFNALNCAQTYCDQAVDLDVTR